MKIKLAASLLGLALVVLTGMGCSQLGNLQGGSKSGGSTSVTAESLLEGYVKGSNLVTSAQETLNVALGLKKIMDEKGLKAIELTKGPTDSSIEESTKFQEESSKGIEEKLKDASLKLSPESKKKFSAGLINFVQGLIQYKSVASDATKYQPSATSIGGTAMTAANIAKKIPSDISTLQSTLTAAINFAKSNGIDVPADASSALPD